MLCQFTFENFKSFKEEAFLDLCAEPINDNEESLIKDKDQEKFLPVISIYGPNGGGKSTVLEALIFLRDTLVRSYIASKMNDDISPEEMQILSKSLKETNRDKYHKFDELCKHMPVKFQILFRAKETEYQYEIAIIKNEIIKESLYYKEIGKKDVVIVFERTEEECVVGQDIEFVSVEKLKNSLPLFSHIASSYDIEVIDHAFSWFLSWNVLDYDKPINDNRVIIPKQDEEKDRLFAMLKEMDINISDIRIEEDSDGKIKDIFTGHNIDDKKVELLIQEESSGTRKILSCLARINNCLQEGELLIADELDAKLHPKLMRYIIELFTDPQSNKKGAQLLLTSHDMVNMIPEIFRRDELWFCALNKNNASILYSLISFKEESGKKNADDTVYGERYLEGRYGADPYIRKILSWGDQI